MNRAINMDRPLNIQQCSTISNRENSWPVDFIQLSDSKQVELSERLFMTKDSLDTMQHYKPLGYCFDAVLEMKRSL